MNRASAEIISDYFRTTSARSGNVSKDYYERALQGIRRRLKGWLPVAGASALDLGCGLGEVLEVLTRCGCRDVTGVNLCQEEVSLARRFVSARIHCQDILEFLQTTERTFDWIGAFNILEHLEKEEILDTIRMCGQHLNPGGVLIIMVPNAISPMSAVTRHWDFTHEWAFTPNNFRQLASISGFSQSIEFRECGPEPHGLVSGMRWIIWQCIRLAIRGYLMVETADAKEGVYTMDMLVRLRKPARADA